MPVSGDVLAIVREVCHAHPGVRFDSATLDAKTTILIHGAKSGRLWFFRFKTSGDHVFIDGQQFTSAELDKARAAIAREIEKRL